MGWASILIVLILQALWAVKDGLVPYEKYNDGSTKDQQNGNNWFGGFGYSYKQEAYGAGGVLIAFLLDVIVPPALMPTKSEEEAIAEEVFVEKTSKSLKVRMTWCSEHESWSLTD